jgi:SAM-dependent methyltransferase
MKDGDDKPAPGHRPPSAAEFYENIVKWDARLARDLPVLIDALGPPGDGGLLDAGCGPGHHACALAARGYKVVGTDPDEEMLAVARKEAAAASLAVRFELASYAEMYDRVGGGFDGLYCLGNSLAAAGTRELVVDAIRQFARCLRPGGRFFLDCLNFTPMLPGFGGMIGGVGPMPSPPPAESTPPPAPQTAPQFEPLPPQPPPVQPPTSIGPGVVIGVGTSRIDGISISETPSKPKPPEKGRLYPHNVYELREWLSAAGLRIDQEWGSFAREPYDISTSPDHLIAGTRV